MTRIPWKIVLGVTATLVISVITLMSADDSEAIVTFAVNSTLDEPDATIGDGLCVSTPSGKCTLRGAIQETNALAGKDIIDVPVGTYTLTIGGASEDAAATGDLDITDDLKIDGASGIAEIDAAGIDRVFDIDPGDTGIDVEIYDVRISNGVTPASQSGGGVLSGSSAATTLLIERTFFDDNTAVDFGGGLYNSSDLTLVDVEFRNNMATDGGAYYEGGSTVADLTNVDFFENDATDDAGAIYLATTAITLDHGLFYENTAVGRGGAVLSELTFSMTTGSFHSNTADMGGAFFADTAAAVTLHDVTMDNNEAATSGGAVYNLEAFDMTSSTVKANLAEVDGGGFFNSGDGVLDLRNVTISGNQAKVNGGGVANYGDLVDMNNVTTTLNIADSDTNGTGMGGGVFNGPGLGVDVAISNTIIGNNGFPLSSPDCAGPITSAGYNLIEDTTGCAIGGDLTGNITGLDPILINLQDNGGNTLTHDLGGASAARDAGNPVTPGTLADSCETIDQRELSRPRDSDSDGTATCDVGALEAPGSVPTATPAGTGSPTPVATDTPAPSASPSPTATTGPTASPTASPTATLAPIQLTWANANCLNGIGPVDALSVLRADAGLPVTQGSPCVPLGDSGLFNGIQRIWGDFDCNSSMGPSDALKILVFDAGKQPIQTGICPAFGELVTLT